MARLLPGQPSCPDCGARATAQAKACAECGCRFLEDSPSAARTRAASGRRVRAAALAAGGVGALACAAILVAGSAGEAGDATSDRAASNLLSSHPLSARAAERQLEARFTWPRGDRSASARCSQLQPRPAHAIRHCRIRYPGGTERTVIVLTNPQGHELLVEP